MNRTLRKLLMLVAGGIVLYLGVTLFANLVLLADAADRFSPGLGTPLFWGLAILFAGLAVWPLLLMSRLPEALVPPAGAEGPEHAAYLARLRGRLRGHPLLAGMPLESDEGLAAALNRLGQESDRIIKDTAGAVFVSTAVMQNGRLDGLIVLATQLRMIRHIAEVHYQRPSLRQLSYLYGNVAGNVLVADSLQEIEFSEIATPIVTAVFPSLKGAVPGMQGISTLLVNSLANGAANAFLTLRVGLITRAYCVATSAPEKKTVRKGASVAALSLVRDIAREQGGRIVSQAWDAVRGTVGTAVEATVQGGREAVDKVATTAAEGVRSVGGTLERSWGGLKSSAGKAFGRKTE